MPSERTRLQALVKCGLLPETAQDIIDDGAEIIRQSSDDAAHITAQDRARARVFVLYSPLIPDKVRSMFDVETLN